METMWNFDPGVCGVSGGKIYSLRADFWVWVGEFRGQTLEGKERLGVKWGVGMALKFQGRSQALLSSAHFACRPGALFGPITITNEWQICCSVGGIPPKIHIQALTENINTRFKEISYNC